MTIYLDFSIEDWLAISAAVRRDAQQKTLSPKRADAIASKIENAMSTATSLDTMDRLMLGLTQKREVV